MNFIQTLGTLILFYAIKLLLEYYWPNYFKAKATNQATIEDTGLITKIQETIKNELSFSNQHKINLMAIEREAIFEFNKSYGTFFQLLSDYTFVTSINFKTFKSKDIDDRISLVKEAHKNFIIAKNHLYLFYNNDNLFLNKSEDLNNKIINFSYLLLNNLCTTQIELSYQEISFGDNNIDNFNDAHLKMSFASKIDKLNRDFFIQNKDSFSEIKISYADLIEYLSNKFKA